MAHGPRAGEVVRLVTVGAPQSGFMEGAVAEHREEHVDPLSGRHRRADRAGWASSRTSRPRTSAVSSSERGVCGMVRAASAITAFGRASRKWLLTCWYATFLVCDMPDDASCGVRGDPETSREGAGNPGLPMTWLRVGKVQKPGTSSQLCRYSWMTRTAGSRPRCCA